MFSVLLLAASRSLGTEKEIIYPEASIRTQIQKFVADHFTQSASRFQIEWLQKIPQVRLLSQPDRVEVTSTGGNSWWGNRVVRITFYRRGRALRSIYVSLKIRVYREVWITRRNIRPGEPISPQWLLRREAEITELTDVPFTLTPEESWIARHHIAAHKILLERDVRQPFLVQKGHHLNIEYCTGGVRIKLQVLALQNGGRGELIWVKNTENRKRLRVKVIGPSLAVVP